MVTLRIDRDNMVSSSEIVRNFSEMLDKTKETPLFITRNNDIEAIIMNIEEYEILLEKIEFLENQLESTHIEEIIAKRKENFELKDAVSEKEIMGRK
ncbi:antitoxin Phd_YefM of type II toxin-antitoxin system [Halanaerobium saccharolyticum]|uniref:Antitoxin n=1 Tax=Halanaerobium saccharolyticum TaxID=43595 RepID=A0A4R7Z6N9_9FIRM|nr:type II toxin-antitoxin system Phd/YefM family antitoxin [Halanaerobium saccharolyticum]RAK11236.1 antitoxin Phd_YefM of type II toxin-antitoxin system [Halanaerobium saccharolyticum]TDW07087.1 antitoxin Phd_YefM of type II toxin-antitoxin system [Halanaerobium saccharolyticum]TDX63852.1 antitoxin Phd_YefM of type II toxin-antitoxin system [Halanaerobium saccharolyticum]